MYDGCITLAAGLSRTRRNNSPTNSYLELGRTGQNGTAQDRVNPPNGAPHRSRRSLHQGVGHRRVLDLTEWPDREIMSPSSTNQDIGIGVVAA